mgnify:CR=1 FL=1
MKILEVHRSLVTFLETYISSLPLAAPFGEASFVLFTFKYTYPVPTLEVLTYSTL